MTFEPIAIVGRGCVLPGALDPDQLWAAVAHGRSLLTEASPSEDWGLRTPLPPAELATAVGGYVRGFDAVFDPSEHGGPTGFASRASGVFRWVLFCVRNAMLDAGIDPASTHARAGLTLGNLSYPTREFADLAIDVWSSGTSAIDARERFMSGLPALLAAETFGLGLGGVALDAACASSLYAMKMACDRLHDGDADFMVAGGVNHADDLYLHLGFTALKALSPSGRSRPFHRDADGLIPAHGAAVVVLKRLADAVRDGDEIHGVIRGLGLSNDGRSSGLLNPSLEGQVRAMRQAYTQSGLDPSDIAYVECHATGTSVGDAVELRGMKSVFGRGTAIGSLKSNLGHLITASGTAGLLKVLQAMAHGQWPATLHVDAPNEELEDGILRVTHALEPWNGPRRAAINNFGFGGNNAHLIVEAWSGDAQSRPKGIDALPPARTEAIVVVEASVIAGGASDTDAFFQRLREPGGSPTPLESIDIELEDLRYPPKDLERSLSQQLAVLSAAQKLEVLRDLDDDRRARTGVVVGMQTDANAARSRWRFGPEAGNDVNGDETTGTEPLQAARVLGCMPNLIANRISFQFDVKGPCFVMSADQASGHRGIEWAIRQLKAKQLDTVIVGAVDLVTDPVSTRALRAMGISDVPGDAVVLIVLQRRSDAVGAGRNVLATIDTGAGRAAEPAFVEQVRSRFGRAHVSDGLLRVAAAVRALHERSHPGANAGDGVRPWLPAAEGAPEVVVDAPAWMGPTASVTLRADASSQGWAARPPQLAFLAADSMDQLLARARARTWGGQGSLRLALTAPDVATLDARLDALAEGQGWPAGTYFSDAPIDGELAFAFTGPAGGYPRMGQDLLLAFPEALDALRDRLGPVLDAANWVYGPESREPVAPMAKLWGSSFMCQLHAWASRSVLGITPAAGLGYSAGESNALLALGLWTELAPIKRDIEASGLFTAELGGSMAGVRRAWGLRDDAPLRWITVRVLAPIPDIREAVAGEQRAHLAIIHGPADGIICGDEAACRRVIDAVGGRRGSELDYNLAMHVPESSEGRALYRALHRRPTRVVPGVRFYSHGTLGPVEHTADAVADALTAQATQTIDFPALVERTYADGVRVYLEHGPRSGLSDWTRQVLDGRPHLAVSLDHGGQSSLAALTDAAARLWTTGIAMNPAPLAQRLADLAPSTRPQRRRLQYPAHRPPPQAASRPPADGETRSLVSPQDVPSFDTSVDTMAPAPARPVPSPVGFPLAAATHGASRPMLRARSPQGLSHGDGAPTAPSSFGPSHGDGSAAGPSPRVLSNGDGALTALSSRGLSNGDGSAVGPSPHGLSNGDGSAVGPSPHGLSNGDGALTALSSRGLSNGGERSAAGRPPSFSPAAVLSLHLEYLRAQAETNRVWQQTLRTLWTASASASPPALSAPATLPQTPIPTPPGALSSPPASSPETLPSPQASAAGALSSPPASSPETLPSTHAAASPSTPASSHVALPTTRASSVRPGSAKVQSPTNHSAAHGKPTPVGPTFDRDGLLVHAGGRISEIFGAAFEAQDAFPRQVRMPLPPLLLAERVTGITGEPAGMGTGTIWTETDVEENDWFLHAGRMPAGILIECGQADLMLISWLGIDLLNRGERVYRLLGCDLTACGPLPKPGETLSYDIHVDGHAQQGDVRLFFFHYDCHVDGVLRVKVRNGQAGFFTDEELEASAGVLWDAETEEPTAEPRRATPPKVSVHRHFSADQVESFIAGQVSACFGPGFERADGHTMTPTIQGGRMRLLDEVTHFEPEGGPWGRGYLRATRRLSPSDWFFEGHFKNDPCMPGTLMFEGGLQAMTMLFTALGFTISRDGWRFEPAPDVPYNLRCRGQATPSSRELVYEIFVDELVEGPEPTLIAAILGSVDGRKAFLCPRIALRLVPDWPMTPARRAALIAGGTARRPALAQAWARALLPDPELSQDSVTIDGFRFDYASLLACAADRPSHAFGKMYEKFDAGLPVPHLPSPPYHFMSAIVDIAGEIGSPKSGTSVTVAYDVPPDAWYFSDASDGCMPLAVLMEVALQPCGWLASFVGCAARASGPVVFRNLDGTGTQHSLVTPTCGRLRTTSTLTRHSEMAGTVILSFEVQVKAADGVVYDCSTTFGFFDVETMRAQRGLPAHPHDDEVYARPARDVVDVSTRPGAYGDGAARLHAGRLALLDRLTGIWPTGGAHGLGCLRAEMDISADQWFFTAHFFQDPVQPGSIGIEALAQAVHALVIAQGAAENMQVTTPALGAAMTWKYRGQVLPEHGRVVVVVEITERATEDDTLRVRARGSLWVDGLRIYEVREMDVQLTPVSGGSTIDRSSRAWLSEFWRRRTTVADWPIDDLLFGLSDRFVDRVIVDPAVETFRGKPMLFLANHQIGVESLLFSLLSPSVNGMSTVALAKNEHRTSWVGRLLELILAWPGAVDPALLTFYDRQDPGSFAAVVEDLKRRADSQNILIHVEGTRAHSCRAKVERMSGVLLELAMAVELPVAPVRFVGGLPVEPVVDKLEFPVGMGRQDYYVGRPIMPDELKSLSYKARIERVIAAINGLGPSEEWPKPADLAFASRARARQAREPAIDWPFTVMSEVLASLDSPSPSTRRWRDGEVDPDEAQGWFWRAAAILGPWG